MYEKLGDKKAREIKNALKLLNDTIREDFMKEDEWKV